MLGRKNISPHSPEYNILEHTEKQSDAKSEKHYRYNRHLIRDDAFHTILLGLCPDHMTFPFTVKFPSSRSSFEKVYTFECFGFAA